MEHHLRSSEAVARQVRVGWTPLVSEILANKAVANSFQKYCVTGGNFNSAWVFYQLYSTIFLSMS